MIYVVGIVGVAILVVLLLVDWCVNERWKQTSVHNERLIDLDPQWVIDNLDEVDQELILGK